MSEPIIAVDHVTKQVHDSTGSLTILHEIDFTLQPQQSAAIVGASGSGKSTLLSIIAGLDTPTTGSVMLAGTDLFTLDEDARAAVRAAKVGFVFQSFQLLGNLNALSRIRADFRPYFSGSNVVQFENRGNSTYEGLATEINAEARRQAGYSEEEIEMLALGVDAEA